METEKIDIKPFVDIISDENARLRSYQMPVKDDRYVYISRPYLMLRIDADRVDASSVAPINCIAEFNKHEVIGSKELSMDQVKAAYEEIKSRFTMDIDLKYEKCPECYGSGKVIWEYMGVSDDFEKTDTCPLCEGAGYVICDGPKSKLPSGYVLLLDHVFYTDIVYKLYKVLDILGFAEGSVDEFDHNMIRINVSDAIAIFVIHQSGFDNRRRFF